jgi:putative addiction module killer protein
MGLLYQVEEYVAANGRSPYAKWYDGLKSRTAKAKLAARIDRASYGNLGDWKSISGAKGVYEMRENSGPGYRIYYSIVGQTIILLLAGSTKTDQDRTIAKAKEYLADYERRVKK